MSEPNICNSCQRVCPDRAPNEEFEVIFACQGYENMNCGTCGQWEPAEVPKFSYGVYGTCELSRRADIGFHRDIKCLINAWVPRPTWQEIVASLEAKESR